MKAKSKFKKKKWETNLEIKKKDKNKDTQLLQLRAGASIVDRPTDRRTDKA